MNYTTVIDNVSNNVDLLMQAYKTEDIRALKKQLNDIFSPQFQIVNADVKVADNYYTKDNNMGYIEQVMEDSVKIITNSERSESTVNAFKADLNFSKNTALELFSTNSDFLDSFAMHMGSLAEIEDVCESFAVQVKHEKNPISLAALKNINYVQDSAELLSTMLVNRMKEMDFIQVHTLDIINKIEYVQNVFKERKSNNPDDFEY